MNTVKTRNKIPTEMAFYRIQTRLTKAVNWLLDLAQKYYAGRERRYLKYKIKNLAEMAKIVNSTRAALRVANAGKKYSKKF